MSAKKKNAKKSIDENNRWYLNKYILCLMIFIVWIIFMDQNNYFTQSKLDKSIIKLEKEKDNYKQLYEIALQDKIDLERNPEKYARDNYFMHKDNEQIFYIKKDNKNERTGQ
jgi:cell division protein FtsB